MDINELKDFAKGLNNIKYGDEISKAMIDEAKAKRIVIVSGASDDLCELEGAIREEVSCYNGGEFYVTEKGLLENGCDNENCPHFEKMKEAAHEVRIEWNDTGIGDNSFCVWSYDTEIPHAKFTVKESGEAYCEGIVFCLDLLK